MTLKARCRLPDLLLTGDVPLARAVARLAANVEQEGSLLNGTEPAREPETCRVTCDAPGVVVPVDAAERGEGAGVAPAVNLALDLVRKRGKFVQMGLPGRSLEVDFEKIAFKELQVSGGIGQRRPAWKRSLKLMERGLIPGEKLISHQLPLEEWEKGFAMAEGQEGIKLLLRPEEG